MDLFKTILEAQNGGSLKQLASQFNLDESQATSAIGKLLPALQAGMKRNMGSQQGLDGLLGALTSGKHRQYIDNPETLTRPETIEDGNNILGHILGSKEVSRHVASRASQETGIDVSILKKMLPAVAAMTMGSMSKQTADAGLGGGLAGQAAALPQGGSSGAAGMLSKMLDSDGDGSIADDLFGMAKKFF